jgi:hypothetical protein
MERAIEAVVHTLQEQLGDDLACIYLYGSVEQPYFQVGQSDANILAVVSDGVDFRDLREAFLPVWAEFREVLGRPPAVAGVSAVNRHLQVCPLFAWHLAEEGRRLWGDNTLVLPKHEPPPELWLAYLAYEALAGSPALAPGVLEPALADEAYQRLHRTARLIGKAPLDGEPPAAELFAQIQLGLRELTWTVMGEKPPETIDDPLAPNLEGIYSQTDRMVVLLPPLAEELLLALDWEAIAERLAARYNVLQATTSQQLILIQQYESAVDFVLGRYHHVWGRDPLAGLMLPLQAVLQNAAKAPSRLLVEDIGGDFICAASDEALHVLIHDYQNRLLNIGLQHELLHRAHGFAAAEPDEPLPPRTAPFVERIEALADRLDWWAGYYTRELQTAATDYVAAI